MRRLLVLGDSVAMPRTSAAQRIDDAWPQRLEARTGARAWVRAAGRRTSPDVAAEAAHLGTYFGAEPAFEAAVVQVGIVDVSPRPVPLGVQRLLDRSPRANGLAVRLGPLLLRAHGRPWVSAAAFERHLAEAAVALLPYCDQVLLIEVLRPGPGLEAKLGPFHELVDAYNDRLRAAASVDARVAVVEVGPLEAAGGHLLEDGHHLTNAGHDALAAAVAGQLDGSSR